MTGGLNERVTVHRMNTTRARSNKDAMRTLVVTLLKVFRDS